MRFCLFITLFLVASCSRKLIDNSQFRKISSPSSVSKVLSNWENCEKFSTFKDYDEDKSEVNKTILNLIQNQTKRIYAFSDSDSIIKDRHKMGVALNQCTPNNNSKALVISFAGTGAYNPRTHSLMAKLIQCKKYQYMPFSLKKLGYTYIFNGLDSKNSSYTKWSGIDKGPMSMFLRDNTLNLKARHFKFANYPSEESEKIADPQKIKISLDSFADLVKEIKLSVSGDPRGIKNAVKCTKKFFNKASELEIFPKLIVLSHSSGARSVVKYLEKIKELNKNINADLVMTIDSVKEAHHAIEEVGVQIAANAVRYAANAISSLDLEYEPQRVWSRKQPNSLYKTTNSQRWINFYQKRDTFGMGMTPKFGIYGSPIENADENVYVKKRLGHKAHGQITYEYLVLDRIKNEVLDLF